MRPTAALLLLLPLLGCAAPAPAPERARPAAPPSDGVPSIVMRGDGVPRDRRPAERTPSAPPPVLVAGPALEFEPGPDPTAPAEEDTGPRALPVVLGETADLRLFGKASADDGTWTATVEVRNTTPYEWAGVDLELTLLAGRRPVGEPLALRVGRLERSDTATETVGGPLPEGVDRVRLRVVEAEPLPGEREVPCRLGRVRNFEVRESRLLRTRLHELDAILDLAGGPFEHVPWATADFEVSFLDARGDAITTGKAQLVRGSGPPWRLHVVGSERSKRQVAAIELRCTNVH